MPIAVAKPLLKNQGRPQPKQPPITELPCGCRIGYGQVLTRCDEARTLYRLAQATGPDVAFDDPSPEYQAYQDHFTGQLERMEADRY